MLPAGARELQGLQVKWDAMKRMHQVLKSTRIQRIRTLDSVRRWKIVSPNFKNDLSHKAYCIKDKVNNDPNCGLFSIFDGHGGRQVSDHCAERIGDEMRKEIAKTPGDLSNGLEQVFLRIDNELRLIDADNTGSTACVCVVR